MALSFQNNQPFVINYDNEFCGTDQRGYCLKKEPTDKLTLVGKFAYTNTIVNVNPTFTECTQINTDPISGDEGGSGAGYTLGAGWSNPSPGRLTKVAGSATSATIVLANGGDACGYLVTVVTENVTAGNVTVKMGTDASAIISTSTASTFYFNKTNTNTTFGINASAAFAGDITWLTITKVYWEITSGWSITCAGYATSSTNNTEPMLLDVVGEYAAGDGIRISCDVVVTAGQLDIEFGGEIFTVPSTGSFVFYGEYTSGSVLTLQPNTTFSGQVNSVSMYRIGRDITASVWDLDNNYITGVSSAYVAKENQNFRVQTTPTELSLSDGCYKLKLSDQTPIEFVTNGTFNGSLTGWTYDAGWGLDEGSAFISGADLADDCISQTITGLTIGQSYSITFTITIGAGGTLIVTAGATSTAYTTSGSKTLTFTATATSHLISFCFSSVGTAGVNLDDVSILAVNDWDYESNCFTVATSFDCDKQLQWYNTVDSFGFKYASTVVNPTFELRITAESDGENYKQLNDDYVDGNMVEVLNYAESREVTALKTEPLPKYLHRCISIARQHQNFYINAVKTIAIREDYETVKTKNKLFSNGRFSYYQEALMFNNAGDDVAGTNEYLIDPETGDCVLSPQ